jgi:hypothetical protein
VLENSVASGRLHSKTSNAVGVLRPKIHRPFCLFPGMMHGRLSYISWHASWLQMIDRWSRLVPASRLRVTNVSCALAGRLLPFPVHFAVACRGDADSARHCRQGPIDDDLDLHAAFSLADPPAGRRPIPARSCAAADEDVNQAFGISLAAYYSFQ